MGPWNTWNYFPSVSILCLGENMLAGQGSSSFGVPYCFGGCLVLGLASLPCHIAGRSEYDGADPLHLPWRRGRSKRSCSASQRQGMPCSPGPEHARKEKETRHLVPVLLCRWTLSCLELALYELAANLNRLFRLFCNHWGSTGTSSGCYPSIENYLKQMGWISLGRWPSPSVDDKGPRLLVYSRCLTFSWWI